MKYIKFLILSFLVAFPAISFSAGAHVPGIVVVNSTKTLAAGYYNVRYNPAVTKGKVTVAINPDASYQIAMTDSNTGVNFTCVTGVTDPNFYPVVSVLENVTGGGNGVLLQASRNTSDNSCTNVTITADSAYLD